MSLTASTSSLSAEEQEQLQQTIEMFEVIVQASPQDTQSLEILKDAYNRLGRQAESLGVARRLADTYRDLGQLSQSLLEYEAILEKEPNNLEIISAIGDVEEKLAKGGKPKGGAAAAAASEIKLDFGAAVTTPLAPGDLGTLITTNQTQGATASGSNGSRRVERAGGGDESNDALAKFLIQNRLVPEEIVLSAVERVTKKNKALKENQIAMSLIDEICRRGSIDLEALLSGMLDRSKFAYIPLEYYEVDRAIVKMLPEDITLARLIIPFDVMSRTLMVAMANPLDAEGKETVQQLLDYNIQWHLASPAAINKVLAETYRLPAQASSAAEMRLA